MSDYFLADDLSGALDAAAGFHHIGPPVKIVWGPAGWRDVPPGVVGFTTETRNASPSVAAAVVAEAIALGRQRGARLVYKKIDSTLRGPIAAEVGALAHALPQVRILFAPANPRVGRTTRDGVLLVNGVPVSETEFGRDPICPVRDSLIPRVLGAAMSERVVIPDVATEGDLEAAVKRMVDDGEPWVAIGSGALARPVAARVGLVGAEARGGAAPALAGSPTLMICGSAHPRNRRQAERLREDHGVACLAFRPSAPDEAVAAATSAIATRGAAALLVEERRGDGAAIVRALARAAAELVRATAARRVFVTGGETAFALARELGLGSFDFLAEIEAGLSLSCAVAPDFGPLHFAIKPGGFGDDCTWLRAWAALR